MFGTGNGKKGLNFGVCACTKINYSTFLLLILGKFISWETKSFFSETKAHYFRAMAAEKLISGLKTALIWCTLNIQRVKDDVQRYL